jgi:hypothetical protein
LTRKRAGDREGEGYIACSKYIMTSKNNKQTSKDQSGSEDIESYVINTLNIESNNLLISISYEINTAKIF